MRTDDVMPIIHLIKRENFDYTEWQRDLWNDLTIDEVFKLASSRESIRKSNDGH